MRTDYNKEIFDNQVNTEQQYPNVTHLSLLMEKHSNSQLTMEKLYNLISFFPKLSKLKIEKKWTEISEEQWNNFILKTEIQLL